MISGSITQHTCASDLAKILQAQLFEAVPLMKIDDLKPKDITSALKDINDIVNPKVETVINNANLQQNETNNKLVVEFK